MNINNLAKQWKEENKQFIEEHKRDTIMLNLAWSEYLDMLQRDGQITMKQWSNHSNLF
jgi:cytoplasmic iron level regulating protein YaaA (DUF328/UPF0246 family)